MADVELIKRQVSEARFVLDIVRRELQNEDCELLRLRLRYVRVVLNSLQKVYKITPEDFVRINALQSYLIYLMGVYNLELDNGGIIEPGSIFTSQFTSQFS